MRSVLAAVGMYLMAAGSAQALCAGLGGAGFGFEGCRQALGEDAETILYCAKPFPYRDPAALEEFRRVNSQIARCLGQPVAGSEDQRVNHPDSYDLRRYRIEGGEVSVSLKDKGGSGQSIVFLRLSGRAADAAN